MPCWPARGDDMGYRDFATRYHTMATSLGFEEHIAIAAEMVGADGIELSRPGESGDWLC